MIYGFFKIFFADFPSYFEFAAFIILLLKWNKLDLNETWVGLLIICNLVFDLFASLAAFHHDNVVEGNLWIYNMAMLPQTILLVYIYGRVIKKLIIKQIMIAGLMFFIVVYFVNLFYGQKEYFNSYSYIISAILIAFMAFMYLHELVNSNKENIYSDFFFWFSVATFIDYTVTAPCIAGLFLYPQIETGNKAWANLYNIVLLSYSVWFILVSFGLLWTKRQLKLSSS